MDIMIGIEDSILESDIAKLAEAGATEFFCGIMPTEWVSVYDYQISLNKREYQQNQILSFEKLAAVIERAHEAGKKVAVAMNAHYYIDRQVSLIESYLKKFREIKVDALIAASIPLLLLIRKSDIDIPIYISGEAAVYNSRAFGLFGKYGIKRIIFPRDMTISEMETVIKNTKGRGLEYEAFVMSEKCPFSAGYCRTTHGYVTVNFCIQSWKKVLYMRFPPGSEDELSQDREYLPDSAVPKPSLRQVSQWNHNAAQYKEFAECHFYQSSSPSMNYWGGCGLCSISRLKEIGITSLKIVSRGTKVDSKILRLKALKRALMDGTPDAEFPMKIKNTREICDLGYACYYREMRGKNG